MRAASADLEAVQLAFYNGRYLEAADGALALRRAGAGTLVSYELRTSALLFQLKHLLAAPAASDRKTALKSCSACPSLIAVLSAETREGQALARGRLSENPADEAALFAIAKLDLNYLWLQLELLGRKKGWNEYWEARRALGALLERHPRHVRARVALAWMDYIVKTRVPRGMRWVFRAGARDEALRAVREAAGVDAEYFVRIETAFALWEMEIQEGNLREAVVIARELRDEFPANGRLAAFLAAHDPHETD
jgi:hypothetical protein